MKKDLPVKRHQIQMVLQAKSFKLMKEIYRPTLHSIDIPGDFLSLFYKDSIALILKSTKDKNKNRTTVQLTTKMNMKALT